MTEREVSSERVSEEKLAEVRGWCAERKAQKPWYGEGEDSPKMLTTCDFMISLIDELLALRSSVKTVGVPIQPLETRPQGEDVMEPSEIEVHEGAWALVMGTNAKAAGWIDTHALFAHQLYRDQILPTSAFASPTPQEAPGEVTDAMVDAAHAVIERSYQNESWEFGPPSLVARAALTSALKRDRS